MNNAAPFFLLFLMNLIIPGFITPASAEPNESASPDIIGAIDATDSTDAERPGHLMRTKTGHTLFVPGSTTERRADIGVRAHTNHLILMQDTVTPLAAPSGYSPDDIRAAYALPSVGGQGTIAIVDAYDYPTAESDLNVFSAQYGLPACTTANGCFAKIYSKGTKPRTSCSWSQEMALDIEWAHAIAPNAKIVLMEASSSTMLSLMTAVYRATLMTDVTEESNSWGGSEFRKETNYDAVFRVRPGIVYFASSGDTGGKTTYPSVSPYVIAAGGTSLNSITPVDETAWSGSGGGMSRYEPRPAYQNGIQNLTGAARGVPDFSALADPATGVSVYDSTPCGGMSGWMVFGGTSVSSPVLAGIVNLANNVTPSTTTFSELTTIYTAAAVAGTSPDFRDIETGTAGTFTALTGWDFITGVGSNIGLSGK
jgi:kumamolisin